MSGVCCWTSGPGVTNPDHVPQNLMFHELTFRRAVHPTRGVVHFFIAGVLLPVLEEVFDGGDDEDDDGGDYPPRPPHGAPDPPRGPEGPKMALMHLYQSSVDN